MNWEAIGALGEIIGATAVVVTLVFLAMQMRQNTRVMQEANRLARIAAMDRHAETVGRWRTSLAENEGLARIWYKAQNDQPLTDFELLRLNNSLINFVNIQRANFERARAIGESGLAVQAARSIAAECPQNGVFSVLWTHLRTWQSLSSQDFVAAVDREFASVRDGGMDLVPWQSVLKDIPGRHE